MAQLVIHDLDDAVKERLEQRAARQGRSMEEEVRRILTAAAGEPLGAEPRLGSAIAARFRRCGLESQIQELRGQQVRPATLRR